MNFSKYLLFTLIIIILSSCKEKEVNIASVVIPEVKKPVLEYGFDLDKYKVVKDTIRREDTFGKIMLEHHIGYPEIQKIVEATKDSFNIKHFQVGKPYTLLKSKDSIDKAKVFIYEKNRLDYVVFDFENDSLIKATNKSKKVTFKERVATGIISANLSQAFSDAGLSISLAYKMSNVYAWSIDFFRLQKNDKFKVVYTEKYLNDTIPVGIHEIKYAVFEHNKRDFYAFNYVADSTQGFSDFYNEEGKILRSQFLRAPVEFSRISSRYNLKRRIKFYGNRVRPHLGTDFAAPKGTPILATANGTVVESTRRGGNGKFVKIRHNGTYSTQYLHMSKQNVKVGQAVKQGDVIGWIGMTGNTSGPHVCYRFWKNGRQVDPLKEKLPEAKPLPDSVKQNYLDYMAPLKIKLDDVAYPVTEEIVNNEEL